MGKKKAKNVQQGMSTLPEEFINRPIIGPDNPTNLASLSPFKVDGVYYMQGRFGKQLKRVLGTDKLPILPPMCELARLLMIKSHCIAHMSANDTCARSRHQAWIVRARPLAKKVSGDCLECHRRFKILLNQHEAPIPEERMFIG